MQLSRQAGINIWFRQRWELELLLGGDRPICDSFFGLPDAAFTWDGCDFDSHFNAQNLLFDLTFCVSWFIPLMAFANYMTRVIGLVTSIRDPDALAIAPIVSVSRFSYITPFYSPE